MRRILSTVAIFIAGISANPTFVQAKDQGHKVSICHVSPGNPANAHVIEVDDDAVPGHLAHGDFLGACQVPGGVVG